jgi:hypothetical protein
MKLLTLLFYSLLMLWPAQAQTIAPLDRQPTLPPPEYDRPVPAHLYTEIRPDQNMLEVLCPKTGWPVNNGYVGCTYLERTTGKCWVIIAPDDVIARTGLTVEQFRRHEQGHCHVVDGRTWSSKHEGGRNLQGMEVIPRDRAAQTEDAAAEKERLERAKTWYRQTMPPPMEKIK